MNLKPSSLIYLAPSTIPNANRGVFASRNINQGDVIETVPVIIVNPADALTLQQTIMRNYYFLWGDDLKRVAIALGYGSLYNHSYEPNATYTKHFENETIEFVAIKTIAKNAIVLHKIQDFFGREFLSKIANTNQRPRSTSTSTLNA